MTDTNIVEKIENRYNFKLKPVTISGEEREKLIQFFDFFSQIVMHVSLPVLFGTGGYNDPGLVATLLQKGQAIKEALEPVIHPDLDEPY